jgi:protein-L-isoaspartate(D-aspartate) O-methyltransferase
MLEQLSLEPGHRVLEIGAGTGYNAALMAHIVDDTGQVITMDIDKDLVESAREHLASAGFDQVEVVCGDGGAGYPSAAPYDRIVLTVGAWDIAPAWWEQLKPSGRLLVPLWVRGEQRTVAFEQAHGFLRSISVSHCGFMRLRGGFAGPDAIVPLGPDVGLWLAVDDHGQIDADVIYQLLTGPSRDLPTGIQVAADGVWEGLGLWLALHEPGFFNLVARGEVTERGIVPYLHGVAGRIRTTCGLLEQATLCALMRPLGQCPPPPKSSNDTSLFELFVRIFGPDDGLAQRLVDQVIAWDAAGRPTTEDLHVRVYPADTDFVPSMNEVVIPKRWTKFAFGWR